MGGSSATPVVDNNNILKGAASIVGQGLTKPVGSPLKQLERMEQRPIGYFNNTGTDCFLNSAVVALDSTETFQDLKNGSNNALSLSLKEAKKSRNLGKVRSLLGAMNGYVNLRRDQNDTAEAMSAILDKFNEYGRGADVNRMKIRYNANGVCLLGQENRLNCPEILNNIAELYCLQLTPKPTLSESFTFTNNDDDEQYTERDNCVGCGGTLFYHKRKAFRLGDVLILQFRRFADLEKKDLTKVAIPMTWKPFENQPDQFELKSAITHFGDKSIEGHYTALTTSNGRYYLVNDSEVTELDQDKFMSDLQDSYVVIYERKKMGPSPYQKKLIVSNQGDTLLDDFMQGKSHIQFGKLSEDECKRYLEMWKVSSIQQNAKTTLHEFLTTKLQSKFSEEEVNRLLLHHGMEKVKKKPAASNGGAGQKEAGSTAQEGEKLLEKIVQGNCHIQFGKLDAKECHYYLQLLGIAPGQDAKASLHQFLIDHVEAKCSQDEAEKLFKKLGLKKASNSLLTGMKNLMGNTGQIPISLEDIVKLKHLDGQTVKALSVKLKCKEKEVKKILVQNMVETLGSELQRMLASIYVEKFSNKVNKDDTKKRLTTAVLKDDACFQEVFRLATKELVYARKQPEKADVLLLHVIPEFKKQMETLARKFVAPTYEVKLILIKKMMEDMSHGLLKKALSRHKLESKKLDEVQIKNKAADSALRKDELLQELLTFYENGIKEPMEPNREDVLMLTDSDDEFQVRVQNLSLKFCVPPEAVKELLIASMLDGIDISALKVILNNFDISCGKLDEQQLKKKSVDVVAKNNELKNILLKIYQNEWQKQKPDKNDLALLQLPHIEKDILKRLGLKMMCKQEEVRKLLTVELVKQINTQTLKSIMLKYNLVPQNRRDKDNPASVKKCLQDQKMMDELLDLYLKGNHGNSEDGSVPMEEEDDNASNVNDDNMMDTDNPVNESVSPVSCDEAVDVLMNAQNPLDRQSVQELQNIGLRLFGHVREIAEGGQARRSQKIKLQKDIKFKLVEILASSVGTKGLRDFERRMNEGRLFKDHELKAQVIKMVLGKKEALDVLIGIYLGSINVPLTDYLPKDVEQIREKQERLKTVRMMRINGLAENEFRINPDGAPENDLLIDGQLFADEMANLGQQRATCIVCEETWFMTVGAQNKKCQRCSSERHNSGHNVPPTFSALNDMHPGKQPPELRDLTVVETAAIAQIVPITKIYRHNGGGTSLRGHSICFGQDIHNFVKELPRCPDNLGIIVIKAPNQAVPLKANKHRLLNALKWLKANNEYYHDIVISEANIDQYPNDYSSNVEGFQTIIDDSIVPQPDASTDNGQSHGDESEVGETLALQQIRNTTIGEQIQEIAAGGGRNQNSSRLNNEINWPDRTDAPVSEFQPGFFR